jgi:hypothetical protein
MMRKIILLCLISITFFSPCNSFAGDGETHKQIVGILSGEKGILNKQSSPDVISKIAYMTVHAAHISDSLDDRALLNMIVTGYNKTYPGLSDDSKKKHFKNLFVVMLATRVTNANDGNVFAAPDGVMTKITTEWNSPCPVFLKDINKEQIETILNKLSFPLVYQSVIATPQTIEENAPINYSRQVEKAASGSKTIGSTIGGPTAPLPPPRPGGAFGQAAATSWGSDEDADNHFID